MRKTFILLVIIFIGKITISAQDHPPFTSMDVFQLEWADAPQISPDGKHIVYIRRGMDIMKDARQARLWLIQSNGMNHQKLTSMDVNEGNPSWSPDGNRIAFTARTDQGTELFVYWLKTGKVARLSQLETSAGRPSWSPDGKWLAFSSFVAGKELSLVKGHKKPKGAKWATAPSVTTRFKHERDGSGKMKPGFSHYFIIPSEGGSPRQITEGNFNHRGTPIWTKDGKSLLFSGNRNKDWEYDFRNSEIYNINIASGKVTALTDRNGPDGNISLSPNGNQIAYLGRDDKVQTYQLTNIYVANVDGSGKKMIPINLDRSVDKVIWAGDGKGLFFQYNDKGDTKIGHTTLAGKTKVIIGDVGGTSIGRPYSGGNFSLDKNNNIVFTKGSPYHPAEVGLVNGTSSSKMLTSLNNDLLDYRTLGKVEEVWYKSSFDGRDIQGWVVTPPNFDASKKYPLLVENHGGPISNYGPWFSPEVQLYATGGYVVFYPNPRGSTSYGEEFGNLLYHNYPGEDYNDVMDGVDHLLKRSYLTEDNLFVTGGSAGGIMTAWMIGKNNRFRSAAVIKPVMNWISKTLTADNYYGYANSRYPGQPWENYQEYWKFSPISLVGNIETPTLVMVGLSDLRTPLSEAKQLYHALKIRKIDTALVEIPGASHFIANRPSQLITKIEHILAWFERSRK